MSPFSTFTVLLHHNNNNNNIPVDVKTEGRDPEKVPSFFIALTRVTSFPVVPKAFLRTPQICAVMSYLKLMMQVRKT